MADQRVLFTGADWESLARILAQEIRSLRESGRDERLRLAVPSQACKHWILRRLAQLLDNDLAGIQASTLHQLALDAFLNKGQEPPEVIEDKRYIFSVWDMIQEGPEIFRYPKNDPYPTVRRLYSSLRELRDAAVEESELEWLSGPEPYERLSPRETERSRKLFALYGAYLKTLQENAWTDSPAMLLQAAGLLNSSAPPLSPLFIWGFYDFTGVQKIFLKAALGASPQSAVFIPEHEFTRPLMQELQGWGMVLNETASYGERLSPLILSCPTAKEEAWITAKLIRRKLQEGAKPSECAVIFRQNFPYFTAMEKALSENGIPFVSHEDPGERLSAKPLGAALKASIAFWESPSAATAAEMLERPASAFDPGLAPYVEPIAARIFSLSRVEMGRLVQSENFPSTVDRLVDNEGSTPRALKENAVREAVRFLKICWEGIEASAKPAPKKLWIWLEKTLRPPQAPHLRPALAGFAEMLQSLSPSSLRSRSFASQILLEAVEAAELGTARTPAGSGGVWLAAANQARGGSWNHLFLCGAVDGAYPMEAKEDPFLSESVRSRLNQLGISGLSRFKDTGRSALEDALLFNLLSASARESMTISIPQLDAESKPLSPSPYLSKWEKNGKLETSSLASSAWEERLKFLDGLCPGKAQTLLTEEEKEWERALDQGGSGTPRALAQAGAVQWKEWLGRAEHFSPTYLSDFLACPQAFYWKQFRRLSGEPKIPQKEFFSPIFLGGAFSRALTESLKRHKSLKNMPALWREILEKEFPDVRRESLAASERYKMRRIESMLESLETEWGKAWPEPVEKIEEEKSLDIPLNGRRLYARADAAMEGGRYFEFKLKKRSIFKSSGARTSALGILEKLFDPESAEGPQYGLQILFYLLDAQNHSGSSATLANAFWELENTKAKLPVFYTWNASEDLTAWKEKLARWVSLYELGEFPFWPHDGQGKRCGFCAYQTLCLKDTAPIRLEHQKLAAPLAATFQEDKEEAEAVP